MKTGLIALAVVCLLQSTLRAAEEPETKVSNGTASAIKAGDTDLRSLPRDVGLTLKNVGTAQLVPILRALMPSYAHLAAFPDRNALIIPDRGANVRRIVEIARSIDSLPKAAAELQPPRIP